LDLFFNSLTQGCRCTLQPWAATSERLRRYSQLSW